MTPDAQRHERKRETGTDRDGQKEGEGDRQTETDRQRQTEIDRQTDRHRRTQEERAREEEKRRGTRREGDGAANWSQTQFSAARAAQDRVYDVGCGIIKSRGCECAKGLAQTIRFSVFIKLSRVEVRQQSPPAPGGEDIKVAALHARQLYD